MIVENKLEVRGLRLFWLEDDGEDSQEKPIALFLHGFPDNAYCWSYQLEYFKKDFKVLAPFIHGTHPSAGRKIKKERYQSDSYCLDLLDLINYIDPDQSRKVLIIGHDVGGVVTNKLCGYLGESRVIGLTYINSMGLEQFFSRKKNPYQLLKSYYIYLFQFPRLADTVFKVVGNSALNKIYDLGGISNTDEIRNHGNSVFNGISVYREYLKEIINMNQGNKKIQVPTLFICSENDPFLELPTHAEVQKFYENPEIRVLEENHWVHRSNHQRVNAILEKTFNKWQ